eukprot:gene33776-8990_t
MGMLLVASVVVITRQRRQLREGIDPAEGATPLPSGTGVQPQPSTAVGHHEYNEA